jgi:hypothetical protein
MYRYRYIPPAEWDQWVSRFAAMFADLSPTAGTLAVEQAIANTGVHVTSVDESGGRYVSLGRLDAAEDVPGVDLTPCDGPDAYHTRRHACLPSTARGHVMRARVHRSGTGGALSARLLAGMTAAQVREHLTERAAQGRPSRIVTEDVPMRDAANTDGVVDATGLAPLRYAGEPGE